MRLMRIVLGCWLVGISAGEAQSLRIPFAVYAGAAAIDLHSTYRFLHYQGLEEANPLGRWADDTPAVLVATSAAMDAAACYAIYRVWGHRHRQVARVILYGVAAVRVGFATDNYRATHGRAKEVRR